MTLDELEKGVDRLPREELEQFAEWFQSYWDGELRSEPKTTKAQENELIRRRDEYLTNPASASDWNDGFLDRLKGTLAHARAQKVSRG